MGSEGFEPPIPLAVWRFHRRRLRTAPQILQLSPGLGEGQSTMAHRNRDVSIRKARRDFLSSKRNSVKESTVRGYEAITRDFIEYLEAQEIQTVQEIDGYLIQQWKIKRKDENNVAPITLHNNVKHLRLFIEWCEAAELVESGLTEKIIIPNVTEEQSRSEEIVSPKEIEDILSYLSTYEYASRLHTYTKLLWHIGCRGSALVSLDLQDYKPRDGIIKIRNRKEAGTPLKNGNKSERNVGISGGVIDLINDYKAARRHDIEDEFGRQPLFTTKYGRLTRQRAYKNFCAVSRPCVYSNNCPHGREIDECEAALNKKQSYSCPSSQSLHPIRRGSITYHLNQDWPVEKVSERCDVSVPVLNKHYDGRSLEDKQQGRRRFVNNL
jgi:integrase